LTIQFDRSLVDKMNVESRWIATRLERIQLASAPKINFIGAKNPAAVQILNVNQAHTEHVF